MKRKVSFLIVGGGLAAEKCAETLRQEGADGSMLIMAAEPYLPYNRPPLSKGLLLGYQKAENIFVKKEKYYADKNIEIALNTRVTDILPDKNIALDDQGNEYEFEKTLIATGCRLRTLPIPGADLENVFYLRTLKDSQALKAAMANSSRGVVVGAGFIGMELASAFQQNNIETTMLVREDKLFSKLYSDELSEFFKNYYEKNGINIIFGESAQRIEGSTKVEKVVTAGGREIECQIMAIGIGVIPEVDFLNNSGVDLDNGVVVDEYLKSSRADLFAAGDVANIWDPIFEKRRRIEHWDNAAKQGVLAARNMLGKEEPYRTISYFFSDMFDISWEFIGDNMDYDETVMRGSFEDQSAILFYIKENCLKAAFLMMQTPKERQQIEKWIIDKTDIRSIKQELANSSRGLEELAA